MSKSVTKCDFKHILIKMVIKVMNDIIGALEADHEAAVNAAAAAAGKTPSEMEKEARNSR